MLPITYKKRASKLALFKLIIIYLRVARNIQEVFS